MLRLQWTDDLKAEADFRAMNISFSKVEIRFSKIDLKESGENCARLGDPLMPNTIRDYAQGMRNGDAFPRPVVYRKAGYILTSGNQRCHAMKSLIESKELEKDPLIEVYELDTPDRMLLEAVARSANVSHGVPASWEDRKAHACTMVAEYGMTVKDAAKLFVVSTSSITLQISTEKTRRELAENGINTALVPSSVIEAVGRLDQDTSVFLKIGNLVAQHVPTAERVNQVAQRIAKSKSESSRLSVVKAFEKDLAQEARDYGDKKRSKLVAPKAPLRPRRDSIIGQLTKLANFLDFGKSGEGFSTLTELQVATESDTKRIRDLWQRIEMRMTLVTKGK
jgi:hypothetical protein